MDFREHVRHHLPPLMVRREPQIVDELAEHLADLYAEARNEGIGHAEALRRACSALPVESGDFAADLRFSSDAFPRRMSHQWLTSFDEPSPMRIGGAAMTSDFLYDLRHAVRSLMQTPRFALAVVVILALGIGANVVIFSAIDAILLRSAAIGEPDQVVSIYTAGADGRSPTSTSSYPDYADLRDSANLAGLAAYATIPLALDVNGTTEPLVSQVVSGNFFEVLGVRLLHGRGFAPEEDRPGTPVRVVVLSYEAWQKYFEGAPAVVGRTVSLNGRPYSVIGIGPPQFSGPVVGQVFEVWVPMALQREVRPPSAGLRRRLGTSDMLGVRGLGWLSIVGRLANGATVDSAAAATDVVARRLDAAYPDTNRGRRFTVLPLGEGPGVRTSTRPLLRALGLVVTLVLLIACANVAGLLVIRAVARQKEVAVRIAVGAQQSRLVRQWLAESLLLACFGAAAALMLAWWAIPLMHVVGIPSTISLSLNVRVFAFAFAVAIGTGLVFGCASVFQMLRRDTIGTLRDEGRSTTPGLGSARLRSGFVVLQVALSVVLLVGAGLFLRTLQNAYSVNVGYDMDHTLVTEVNLDLRGYTPEAGQLAYARILEGVGEIPGVQTVGAARLTVLSGNERVTSVSTDGQSIAPDGNNALHVRTNVISHGYLAALGVPMLRGRDFRQGDRAGTQRVAIVSRSLAARLWQDADPIGKTLVGTGDPLEVVGVVPDVVYSSALETDPPPFFFSALAQNYESAVALHVRTAMEPMDVYPAVRRVVREVDASLTLSTPMRLSDVFGRSLDDQRLMARLVGVFGVLALTLAMIGLYGVMAHLVAQRRNEIGVRLALGAQPRSILKLVVGEGLRLVLFGAGSGIVGALVAARYIESQLFGVTPADPTTLAAVVVPFVLLGTLTCFVPARRAMLVDPVAAFRQL